ncbi:MAG: hypothetical protein ABI045_05195 [Flavobacteriales bacterium]
MLYEILKTTSIDEVKYLLCWHVLNGAVPRLSSELERAHVDFYSKVLKGIPKMQSLERGALDEINLHIVEPLGKLYIKEVFPSTSQKKICRNWSNT